MGKMTIKQILLIVVMCLICFGIGHWMGYKEGQIEITNTLFAYFHQKYSGEVEELKRIVQSGQLYQTSEYQWKGPINRKYSDMMLEKHNLKHDEGWRIDCPKCETASIKRYRGESWTDYRRLTNTMDIDDLYAPFEGCQWYCAKCLYPLGIDWIVTGLSEFGELIVQ